MVIVAAEHPVNMIIFVMLAAMVIATMIVRAGGADIADTGRYVPPTLVGPCSVAAGDLIQFDVLRAATGGPGLPITAVARTGVAATHVRLRLVDQTTVVFRAEDQVDVYRPVDEQMRAHLASIYNRLG